jgi:ABC-type dipeptide/oligopeptide/nickel transport system permease component
VLGGVTILVVLIAAVPLGIIAALKNVNGRICSPWGLPPSA